MNDPRDAALRQALEALTDADAAKSPHMNMKIAADFIRAALAAKPEPVALQGGMSNAELSDAWARKLPGVVPTERDLTAFALGVEVGFEHARNLERQDWSRIHHALAKHGEHPGRTEDHLADVIDRVLARLKAAPPQREPLTDEWVEALANKPISRIALIRAVERKVRGE